jgi:arginyl-tRNA synthetase
MVISKIVKQSPLEIAKNISYKIKNEKIDEVGNNTMADAFESIEAVAPGFINFKLSNNWLIKLLNETVTPDNAYGIKSIGNGMRIALEHSNVNPNKAVHVGHLRNASVGQFIERAYEKQGFDVEVQYYANDVGVQVATSMMGSEKNTTLSPTSYKKFDHYAWDVYADMESKIQQSEELQKERLNVLTKLEDPKNPEAIKQKELANKIMIEQLKTFQDMGFDYDVIIYESDILIKKLWEKALELLKANPNVYYAEEGKSKGCWLVRLGEKGAATEENADSDIETDKIIVRSNGVATYTGKDIAYHMWKYGLLGLDFGYKKWNGNTQEKPLWTTTAIDSESEKGITFSGVKYVFDVIGTEQTYAIDVVKRSLAFLGFPEQAANMRHINYGFVFVSKATAEILGIDVSDGKKFYAMSGRRGWGVKVDDLIEKIEAKLTENYGNFENVSIVRNAAIKFSMLKINTFQDLIFDLDDALDLKGYSGPYVQYAYVRANSVIKKSGLVVGNTLNIPETLDIKERAVIKQLTRFPEIVEKSAASFAPNLLCEYLFDLAKKFNTFYNDLSILNADDAATKEFRLSLCSSVRNVLKEGLWLLGIESPEKM